VPEIPKSTIDHVNEQAPVRRGRPGTALIGAILIVVGLVFFIGQALDVDLTDVSWPFYVIAPGVALLAIGLTQERGSGLTIAGSIVTVVGLVLLYQNSTDHWESWAYAWALVGPGGSGIGMLLYGTRSRNPRMARDGLWQILAAIGLFAAGFIFFEGIIGISGRRLPLPAWVIPVAIIALGLVVLVRGFTSRPASAEPAPEPTTPPTDAKDTDSGEHGVEPS
jgi:hypothetical protein